MKDFFLTQLRAVLPHRLPLLDFVRMTDADHFTAVKNVTIGEPFFQGHFPGHPIMPGVLQLEAMKQLAEVAVCDRLDPEKRFDVYLARAERVKFRRPVVPGDRGWLEAEVVSVADGEAAVKVKFSVPAGVASEANLFLKARPREFVRGCPPVFDELDFAEEKVALDANKIMKFIPHRYPFLLIDYILEMQDESIRAIKNLSQNEPFFDRSDPAFPVFPESILCEIAAQAGCASVLSRPENAGKIGVFMAIDKAESFFPVGAGDRLLVRSLMPPSKAKFGKGKGEIVCNGAVAFSVQMMFAVVDA
ncbi:MAG: hypothetical protein MJ016_00875 [Victivallaceae bacterium]|nr:hypothetical protein [Victivallaceae bacterium]